jgi:hypothetical protein
MDGRILGSHYRSGRARDWLKFKNPAVPAVKQEAEEEGGRNDAGECPPACCTQR